MNTVETPEVPKALYPKDIAPLVQQILAQVNSLEPEVLITLLLKLLIVRVKPFGMANAEAFTPPSSYRDELSHLLQSQADSGKPRPNDLSTALIAFIQQSRRELLMRARAA